MLLGSRFILSFAFITGCCSDPTRSSADHSINHEFVSHFKCLEVEHQRLLG